MIYRIELAGSQIVLARTPPVPRGARLVFSRHPDGAVMSLKRSEVKRVVTVSSAKPDVSRNLRPGEMLVLGPTGEGRGGGETAAPVRERRPGETPDGKALFNSSRDYRPEWDARQVPGQSLAFPASLGDYREGATLAYPPGGATQTGPGQPPTGVPSGPPPKSP